MNKYFFYILLFSVSISFSQVGIETTIPKAKLDVNGDLRVRTVTDGAGVAAETSVLIVDAADVNIVKKVPSKTIVNSYLKSLVKGNFLGASTGITISVLSWNTIPFDHEDIDETDEYDTSTSKFTAKQDGVYEVYSQIKMAPVSVGDFGVGIVKEVSGTETVLAKDNYVGVSVTVPVVLLPDIIINVSSPYRRVRTIVKLNAGESIILKVYSLVSVSLTGGEDSFFTIKQIR
jgi:hypothetical protein